MKHLPYLIMTRTGTFTPKKSTKNQCGTEGHSNYLYTVKMIFDKGVKLDNMGFLFDHQHLDDFLNKEQPYGSCEEIHYLICEAIQFFMLDHDLPMLAVKCIVKPKENGPAFMEHVWWDEDMDRSKMLVISLL